VKRETLTSEQIIQAAVALLDREGLEGLNMRALGSRLGSAATAVYWHVGSKENLVALASDQAWDEIALPDLAAVDWRTAATSLATELYAMLNRHPWLLQAFGSFLSYGPGKARHDDCGLAIYELAGFRGAQADQAATIVFTFVLGNALGPAAAASLSRKISREGDNADELMRESMLNAREIASGYPRLAARLETPSAGYGAAPAHTFEFGLQVILDGLGASLRRLQSGSERIEPSNREALDDPD
jgi:AcrR family transcriptional regulator